MSENEEKKRRSGGRVRENVPPKNVPSPLLTNKQINNSNKNKNKKNSHKTKLQQTWETIIPFFFVVVVHFSCVNFAFFCCVLQFLHLKENLCPLREIS